MRRIIVFILLVSLVVVSFASSKATTFDNYTSSGVFSVQNVVINPQTQAEMLQKLTIFRGTDQGFELDQPLKRVQAAVLLVRLLGSEQTALAGSWQHPFSDVPTWATPYVGWLYQEGLTKGVSSTQFGGNQNTTMEQFAIFLSRAMSGDSAWQFKGVVQLEEALAYNNVNQLFTRAKAVELIVRALAGDYTIGTEPISFAQHLINQKVFSKAQFISAAHGLYSYDISLDYQGYIETALAGVNVGKTTLADFNYAFSEIVDNDHFYASRTNGDAHEIYQINTQTLNAVAIGERQADSDGIVSYLYIGTVDGVDYLIENDNFFKSQDTNRYGQVDYSVLLAVAEQKLSVIADNADLDGYVSYQVSDDIIYVNGFAKYYMINQDGVKSYPYQPGSRVIDARANYLLILNESQTQTQLSLLKASTKDVLQSYTVDRYLQTLNNSYLPRRIDHVKVDGDNVLYYGVAGLYRLALSTGEFLQLSDRPTIDVVVAKAGYIGLAHPLSGAYNNGVHTMGDQLYYVANSQGAQPIDILQAKGKPTDFLISAIAFDTNSEVLSLTMPDSVGHMTHDLYTVALQPAGNIHGDYSGEKPTISVINLLPGRPEVEDETSTATKIANKQTQLNSILDDLYSK